MRDVGVDSPFTVPDGEYSDSHSTIHSDCEKWLLDIELNLDSSLCTFGAVQWALLQLERMELQERISESGGDVIEDEETEQALLRRTAGKEQPREGASARAKTVEKLSIRLEPPARIDSPPATKTWTANKSVRDTPEEKRSKRGDDKDATLSGRKLQGGEAGTGGAKNWRHLFNAGRSGKRKTDEIASPCDGEKKAKVSDLFVWNRPEDVVLEADRGEAGKRMAERINSRLAVPDCIPLTNLVSHCLLVSMDQVPAKSIQKAVFGNNDAGAVNPFVFDDGNGHIRKESSDSSQWMWLHNWLVRTVLSDDGDDGRFASLDWLIAFTTATRQSLFKPILNDLASDLVRLETSGLPTLPCYMRRIGVLEYAAYRDPERIFGSLRPLFPPQIFPSPQSIKDGLDGGFKIWQGWLGLMMLCPKLFGAFCRTWVPTLSPEMVLSWRLDSATIGLPAIWTILVDSCQEEPRTIQEWLYTAIIRRLPELAPVATSFVILLAACDKFSMDIGSMGSGNCLLTAVYKELSKHVLPTALGSSQDCSREVLVENYRLGGESGILHFMDNLQQHAHVLWRKALDHYSTLKCAYCDASLSIEHQIESCCKTEVGNDGRMCIDGEDVHCGRSGFEFRTGCMYRDPLIQVCLLALLGCTEHTVADLLANASSLRTFSVGVFEAKSLRKLLMVMRAMKIVSGQGHGALVLELWAQRMICQITVASDEQALHCVLAMRQLLDPAFWQKYHILVSSSQIASANHVTVSENATENSGLSWKLVWTGLRKVLEGQWLRIWQLMLRDGAWDLKLAVLGILQLLNSNVSSNCPQDVADRLKGVLGLFFSWLEMSDGHESRSLHGKRGTRAVAFGPKWRWQFCRTMEQLKFIIIELASSSFSSFTLMVNSLLDFSFQHSIQMSSIPSQSSSTSPFSRTELSGIPFRRSGSGSHSSFSMAPLSTGRLDRYGNLVLVGDTSSQQRSSSTLFESSQLQLTEQNCRIHSGAITSLQLYENKERIAPINNVMCQDPTSSLSSIESLKKDLIRRTKVLEAELGSLLRRTLSRATSRSTECPGAWPCHPAGILATHMSDRMETPHEIPMTMEQYEEVLPKHTSSLRHIFLADCFSQNPLLMDMVELVFKYGRKRDVQRCVEFVRVLLADSISRWHSAFRTRETGSLPRTKVDGEELWNRMQVNRLIQLVATADWLPQPLAASGEIVAVIDGADIADLLLLVWRCMHHAMAFGTKSWKGSSPLSATGNSMDPQTISTSSGAGEDVKKEETYTEWESHYFAILRRNVSHIGAHFAQLYPIGRAF